MTTHYTKGQPFRWMRLLSLLLLLLPLAGRGQSTTVVISQVYGGGGSNTAGATYTRDYVELFNKSASAVSIAGYTIQYGSSGGTTAFSVSSAIPAGTTLQPGQYFLVVLGTAGTAGAAVPSPNFDPTATLNLSSTNGKVALVNGSGPITAATPAAATGGTIVDFVGYGSANASETTPVPVLSISTGAVRNSNGCTDTNNNSTDFAVVTNPVPRNAASTLAPCGGAVTPAEINVKQGATTYLTSSTYSGFASTTVGSTDAKTFTIENLGGTVLNVSSITATGDYSVSGAPTTVAANSTANFTVTFTPTAAGTRTGVLTINNDDADEATYVINLSGNATASTPNPMIAVSQGGTAYANASTFSGFANTTVGSTSPAVTFTITNSSTTDALTITGITTTGNFAVSGAAPTTVAPNSTATFNLTFTPTAAGTRTGTVTIANNSQGTPSYVINLSGQGIAAAPTATNYSATSLLAGIQSTEVVTGTNLSGATVTITGSTAGAVTVGTVTASSTQASFTLLAPQAGSFTLNVTTAGGTLTQAITVTTPPTGFFEPFEAGTKSAYPSGDVVLTTGSWNFTEALLGAQPPTATPGTGEKKNNGQAVRLRTLGTASMNFDKANGAGAISFQAALYGTDAAQTSPASALLVEISTNQGTSYTVVGSITPTATLSPYTLTANVAGPIRLRFSSNTTGATPRIDFDDLQIADFTAAVCSAPTGLSAGSITSTTASVSFTPNGSATSYTATLSPATANPAVNTQTVSGSPVNYSGLTPNTAYTVSIVSNCAGGATSSAAMVGFTTAALADLVISTGTLAMPTPVTGNYNNITVTGTGVGALVGPLTAAGTLTIQNGGILAQSCQVLSGTGNFDLQAGGTLIICDAAGISPTGVPTGAVMLTGTRTYSPLAQYIYNGTAAQVTGLGLPGTILALGVQNTSNVTLSQALSLTQGLNLSQGNLNTGGFAFTLLSSAGGTAGVVNTGGVVVGNTTVQRFINSSNPIGYRHYSAPVSNTTLGDLTVPGVFTPTFNAAYNTSPTPGTTVPFPTVFGYNQDRIATVTSNFSAFDKGWFSPAGAGDPMVVGKGYTVNAPNSALVDFVGSLNNGAVPSGTLNRGTDPAAGWHLLGNPYPSPIDWSTVTAAQRPNMDAAIYVFESAGQYGGSYRASVNGVGGNANSPQPIVVSSQGYFVRVSAGQTSGAVNLDNSNRVTTFGPQPSFGRGTADTRPQVALTLQGASVADAAYVYFQAGATAGKDVEFDASKLPNSHGLNLTSLAAGEALAINGLPVLGTATVLVPLNVAAPQAGSYALKADALANLAGTTVTLIDALTSTRTVLAAGTSYAFALASTTAAGRFSLEFRPTGALATTPAQALAAQTQLFPNPASASFRVQLPVLGSKTAVQATLLNALGQTVLRRSLSAAAGQAIDAEFDVRALAAGVYTLRLDVAGTLVTRKVVVE